MTEKNDFQFNKKLKKEKFDIGHGKEATLSEIVKMTKLSYATIYARIRKGYRGEDLVNTNLRKKIGLFGKKVEVRGKMMTAPEIAKKYNIPAITVYRRIESGYTGEDLIQDKLKRGRPLPSSDNDKKEE